MFFRIGAVRSVGDDEVGSLLPAAHDRTVAALVETFFEAREEE
jgi:hypothetical protein